MFFFAFWIVVPSQSRTQMSLGDLDTVAYEVTVQLISPGVSSTYSRDMGQVPKQVTKQYRHVAPPPPFVPGRNREGKRERESEKGRSARSRARSQHPRTHNLLPPPRPHRIHAARKRDRSHFSPSSASPSRCRDPNTQLFLFFFPVSHPPTLFRIKSCTLLLLVQNKVFPRSLARNTKPDSLHLGTYLLLHWSPTSPSSS